MKKFVQIIGLISLICFSFFVNKKTNVVMKEMDSIMDEIKINKSRYEEKSIDATVEGNKIIPGIRGKNVNINKSYKKMKKAGFYSFDLLEYDYIKPKRSIEDSKDKYIIKGNSKKRMISLLFLVKNGDDISFILKTLNNYNIKASFFVNENWFNNNSDKIQILIDSGHDVGLYLDNYNTDKHKTMDNILKKVNHEKNVFCVNPDYNDNILNNCYKLNNYTVVPILINDLKSIKINLNVGSFYLININKNMRKELSNIIISIKSKGYNISNLKEHVLE